jgi:hypothetical protein
MAKQASPQDDARRRRLARYTTWTRAEVEELDEALRWQRTIWTERTISPTEPALA